METAITKIANELNWRESEVAIIKNSVAKNTTDTELAFFLFSAKAIGLNPILKEIWCYKDARGNLIIFAGRDGFLSIAHKSNLFGGMRSCEVRENDEFQINIPENKITHSFGSKDRGKIMGAYAIVWKKDCEPSIEWCEFDTYNKGYNTWKSHPAEMIKKVAESHALKKAFGISGIQNEADFEIVSDIAFPIDTNGKPEMKKISYVESLLRNSTLDPEKQSDYYNRLAEMSNAELDSLAESLRNNQLHPIYEKDNYSAKDIQTTLKAK